MASPWFMSFLNKIVKRNGLLLYMIFEVLFIRRLIKRLMNIWDSLICFIAFSSIVWFTESKAIEISKERIHSSSLEIWFWLYIELRICIGWNVFWLGRPVKLSLERILFMERMLPSFLVRILVKIFLKESRSAIDLVSVIL